MTPEQAEIGDWIQTFTGREFWPLDPKPKDVAVHDIAHALGMKCRYNGHTTRFYSVAEHSVHLWQSVKAGWPSEPMKWMMALLHDGAEAYLPDVPRPVKPFLANFHDIERKVEDAIQEAFTLPAFGSSAFPGLKELDTRILVDEVNAVMPNPSKEWHRRMGPPLNVRIYAWTPLAGEFYFLRAFNETGVALKAHAAKGWLDFKPVRKFKVTPV